MIYSSGRLGTMKMDRDEGPAEVFNWYHDEDRKHGWRGVKVVLHAETAEERILATFDRPSEDERTMTIRDIEEMNDLALDWADSWNSGGARREQVLREAGQ